MIDLKKVILQNENVPLINKLKTAKAPPIFVVESVLEYNQNKQDPDYSALDIFITEIRRQYDTSYILQDAYVEKISDDVFQISDDSDNANVTWHSNEFDKSINKESFNLNEKVWFEQVWVNCNHDEKTEHIIGLKKYDRPNFRTKKRLKDLIKKFIPEKTLEYSH